MKINAKVRYGLKAMIELAMNAGQSGLLQKEISEYQKIPGKYLDKIISGLKTGGLIRNVKGKKSGYILTRSAVEISIYDIYRAFEPDISLNHNFQPDIDFYGDDFCAEKDYWNSLILVIENHMKSETLDKIASKQREYNLKEKSVINFEI